MRVMHYAALALASAPAASIAKYDPPPMPAGYDDPGPRPVDVLDQIVARLRTDLKDPHSVRDFILCPVRVSEPRPPFDKRDHWTPARWSGSFALNSKNSYGGYTGQQDAFVWFRAGKIDELSFATAPDGSALEADLAKARAAYLATCERVSDLEVQKRLTE